MDRSTGQQVVTERCETCGGTACRHRPVQSINLLMPMVASLAKLLSNPVGVRQAPSVNGLIESVQ